MLACIFILQILLPLIRNVVRYALFDETKVHMNTVMLCWLSLSTLIYETNAYLMLPNKVHVLCSQGFQNASILPYLVR